jgi:hypothetical protein
MNQITLEKTDCRNQHLERLAPRIKQYAVRYARRHGLSESAVTSNFFYSAIRAVEIAFERCIGKDEFDHFVLVRLPAYSKCRLYRECSILNTSYRTARKEETPVRCDYSVSLLGDDPREELAFEDALATLSLTNQETVLLAYLMLDKSVREVMSLMDIKLGEYYKIQKRLEGKVNDILDRHGWRPM